MKEIYYLYIIQSKKDNSFYIGITGNIEKRLEFHNKGLQRYTRNKTPWKLVYYKIFKNKTEALKREREIKKKKSRKYIEFLIGNDAG